MNLTPAQYRLILAGVVTIGFMALLALFMFHAFPNGASDILDAMTGVLGTAFIGIINYYFGSSSGSDRKTELLAQQGNGQPTK